MFRFKREECPHCKGRGKKCHYDEDIGEYYTDCIFCEKPLSEKELLQKKCDELEKENKRLREVIEKAKQWITTQSTMCSRAYEVLKEAISVEGSGLLRNRLTGTERSALIEHARKLKEFCKSYECDTNQCPFVQCGICAFTTKPPKLWGFACLLETRPEPVCRECGDQKEIMESYDELAQAIPCPACQAR